MSKVYDRIKKDKALIFNGCAGLIILYLAKYVISYISLWITLFYIHTGSKSLSTSEYDYLFRNTMVVIFSVISITLYAVWYHCITEQKNGLKPCKSLLTYTKYAIAGFTMEFIVSAILLIIQIIMMYIDPSIMQNAIQDYDKTLQNMELTNVTCISSIRAIIFAPIIEEIMYRGLAMEYINNITDNRKVTIFFQALLFSVAHGTVIQILYALFMGILLGKIKDKTGSIVYTIFFHAAFNTAGVVTSILEGISSNNAAFQPYYAISIFIIPVIGSAFYYIITRAEQKRVPRVRKNIEWL